MSQVIPDLQLACDDNSACQKKRHSFRNGWMPLSPVSGRIKSHDSPVDEADMSST